MRRLNARSCLRATSIALVATVWLSATLFGLYILAFYAAALLDGDMASWNGVLPGLYRADRGTATVGIGLHFAAGGVILLLGCIQLVSALRVRYPAVHRWLGRVYAIAALLTGVGGLIFIAVSGTIGGAVMDLGFSIYGVLMVLAAIETVRHARAGRMERHRAWALRLFALAIGSWLYRMDYGFWALLADNAGHTRDFRGPFDRVMAFFFYVPNLILVEVLIRARRDALPAGVYLAAAGALACATGFLLLGTYFFTRYYWGPAILARVLGA
ncbi:DUF2306 domain-containing protein [Haliangium ochraceum]|uniref:DUF2306 domain-containing protein n=1 Tax=Haliangium ochraceum (strain DSM 14365 / JCM 11303 / SMP-2) TaxID=502025 RepID=D0LQH7_HALO1|nr:DUF2306 domain-containing protein [Haliangium ochraceum]ACY18986.1 conserved hypothetical protein [Haliangium ochraceum DSM 14365]